MKNSRSLSYLLSTCVILIVIISTLIVGCSSESATTTVTTAVTTTVTTTATATATATTTPTTTATATVPTSVLECPQDMPTLGETPQYGGTLKIIASSTSNNLGAPWLKNSKQDALYSRFMVEGLTGLNSMGEKVPQLATGWELDADAMTITFTLREGVKFHDGTDFNADAVKWCLDMYRNGTKSDLNLVESIDVLDNYTVRLNCSAWDPFLINGFGSQVLRMVSPTAAQKLIDEGKENDIMQNPVATGPFKLESFVPNVSQKMVAFDDYWQEGLPYLDAVEISFVTDSVVALASYVRGEADVINTVGTVDAQDLAKQGHQVWSYVSNLMTIGGDSINPDSPFADINVRRAIAYALNASADCETVYGGFFAPTNQMSVPGKTAYDPSIVGYPYNQEKAKELLALAGYSTSNPLSIKMTYNSDPQLKELCTIFQAELAEVGIDLTLETVDNAAYTSLRTADWNKELILIALPYNELELQYNSTLRMCMSVDRFMFKGIELPDEYNALYAEMLAADTLPERVEYYKALNKMATDDYCMMVPLFGLLPTTAGTAAVHDCGISDVTASEFLPEIMWLEK